MHHHGYSRNRQDYLGSNLTVSYAESGYDIFEISEDADEINGIG